MQLTGEITAERSGVEIQGEYREAVRDEAKWFILWTGIWIVALGLLLPALI